MGEEVYVFGADDLVMIPVRDLFPNSWNPQEMTEAEEAQLEREILEDGFDEPLLVVPHAKKEGKFTIIAGEHRWNVAKKIKMPKLPCFVKDAWDEESVQMAKTVRRNVIRGSLDAAKFSKLTNLLAKRENKAISEMPDVFGMDQRRFERVFIEEESKKRDAMNQAMGGGREDRGMIGDISFTLNEIFDKYGDTAPQGFMFFMYGGEMHLLVRMDDELSGQVEDLVEFFRAQNAEVVEFFKEIIGDGLAAAREEVVAVLNRVRGEDEEIPDEDREVGKGNDDDSV